MDNLEYDQYGLTIVGPNEYVAMRKTMPESDGKAIDIKLLLPTSDPNHPQLANVNALYRKKPTKELFINEEHLQFLYSIDLGTITCTKSRGIGAKLAGARISQPAPIVLTAKEVVLMYPVNRNAALSIIRALYNSNQDPASSFAADRVLRGQTVGSILTTYYLS